MKHLTAEPDLSALAEPYRGIVERALAKDPNLRLKSVGELVALLPSGGALIPFSTPVEREPGRQPEPAPKSVWPASRGPALKAADAAAMDGLKQVVHWNQAAAETIEEPIWKAVRNGASYLRRRWNGDGMPPLSGVQKSLLVIAIVWGLLWFFKTTSYFGPAVISNVLILYVIYYLVWSLAIRPNLSRRSGAGGEGAPTAVAASPLAARPIDQQTVAWPAAAEPTAVKRGVSRSPVRQVRSTWRERANQQLAAKPLRQKLTELMGSMLLAAMIAALASSIGPLFSTQASASQNLGWYLWLAIVGTLGSWAVLVPAKLTEGKLEDQVPMRLTLLLLGAAVGFAAWYLGSALMLTTPTWGEPVDVHQGLLSNELLNWPKSADANIYPIYYIAYFAFLFLVPRWWRQTEFTRTSRLSLWWVMTRVGWAWLLHVFWWFPQPAGMLVAAVIGVSTQLASPWMPPSQRRTLSEAPATAAV
jgi:hypothetical protein